MTAGENRCKHGIHGQDCFECFKPVTAMFSNDGKYHFVEIDGIKYHLVTQDLMANIEDQIVAGTKDYEDMRKFQAAYIKTDQELRAMKDALQLALSFAPKGPVPEGLAGIFYHTCNYEDDLVLQEKIDKARELIK